MQNDDLISRQAVLKELPHALWGKEWDEALAKAIIESVPTIDPVKHGKWNRKSEGMWTCSECKKDNAYAYVYENDFTNFKQQDFYCPNCGALMDKGEPDDH